MPDEVVLRWDGLTHRVHPDVAHLISYHQERASRAEAERDEARKWAEQTVAQIAAARTVTCVYCGHQYANGTPQSQDERLTEHIKICTKHPMRTLEAECRLWQAIARALQSLLRPNLLQEEYADAACKAEATLEAASAAGLRWEEET